eukprot:TRINITY_DN1526_c2_g2_i1.p1 TRINITY_DN1526_c2_g2~~TRINITY_DN1526_c2_g2_i1.p1  ORF type:complete len:3150 (+),score=1551.60 TRINITY_DN1526_c2_g2_i1:68-9451(+)
MAEAEDPPEPRFTLPKTAPPPYDDAALVDVRRVYYNPADFELEVSRDLVTHLKYANFTPESLAGQDVERIAQTMQVLQMLFDAGESDINWYTSKLNDTQQALVEAQAGGAEVDSLRQALANVEGKLKERAERVEELEAEVKARNTAEREVDKVRRRLFDLQGELDRTRTEASDYRKSAEKKMEKQAAAESQLRKDLRESERDLRAMQTVAQQHEQQIRSGDMGSLKAKRDYEALQEHFRQLETQERQLAQAVQALEEENEELKLRLDDKDDQCLSLERRAVNDLQTFKTKAEDVAYDREKTIRKLKQDLAQMGETVAVSREEALGLRQKLSDAQQQKDVIAEMAAKREKDFQLRMEKMEKERQRIVHQAVAAAPGGQPLAADRPYDLDDYSQVTEMLKQAKRDLTLEQARAKDDRRERERLDRDVADLRAQLDVYERAGPGVAVRDMRGTLTNMTQVLEERDEALCEMRDKLNQADEDLDYLLQFTESLKHLCMSLGVTRQQILALSNDFDAKERRSSELEELREKLAVRDKEIELLERERLHWKKQVRLQAMPKLEQAKRMGLTTAQLDVLSEITDAMRESGLSDVQALVGMGADAEVGGQAVRGRAELERRLELANEKNEVLTEIHQKLRKLYIEVCQLRDDRAIAQNISADEAYMLNMMFPGRQMQGVQLQPVDAEEGSESEEAPPAKPAAGKPAKKSSSTKLSSEKKEKKRKKDKKPKSDEAKVQPPAGAQVPPFTMHLIEQMKQALQQQGGGGGGGVDAAQMTQVAQDCSATAQALTELRKELTRMNTAVQDADRRAQACMEERDSFRRTLALRNTVGAAVSPTPSKRPQTSAAPDAAPAGPKPSDSHDSLQPLAQKAQQLVQGCPAAGTGAAQGDTAQVPAPAAPGSEGDGVEVWDTSVPALDFPQAQTEIEYALQELVQTKEAALQELLAQFDRKEADVVRCTDAKVAAEAAADASLRALQSKDDDLLRLEAQLRMLQETLDDAEQNLKEERSRLEEHQEFIAGLGGARDGDAVAASANEALRKVTAMRVNEIRLIHRYKMAKTEADTARSRQRHLELEMSAAKAASDGETVALRAQLKEAETVQRVLHERLQFVENTRTYESLKMQLAAAKQEAQTYIAMNRELEVDRAREAALAKELQGAKAAVDGLRAEKHAQAELVDRITALQKLPSGETAPGEAKALRAKVVELDVEVKEARQKAEAARRRCQAALEDQNASDAEKQEMKADLISLRQEKAELLTKLQTCHETLQHTVSGDDARALQDKLQAAETARAKAESKALHALEMSQASVEQSVSITQIQRTYKEELDMLRRVVEGMEPTSEEGYILGEMQFRTFQLTVENISLKKEKDSLELAAVAKASHSQALRLQNTQLLSELAKVYDEYISRSHELHQENSGLKADLMGRLNPEESAKLSAQLAEERRRVAKAEQLRREADGQCAELAAVREDRERLRTALATLAERDMTKVEAAYKHAAAELSTTKLAGMKHEWQARQLTEEVAMLKRVGQQAEERMEILHQEAMRMEEERNNANSEFSQKVEELYLKLKDSKKREAVAATRAADLVATNPPAAAAAAGDDAGAKKTGLVVEAEHVDALNQRIRALQASEASSGKTISEMRAAHADLKSDLNDARAEVAKKDRVLETLQQQVLREQLVAKQAVERVRQTEASRSDALQSVAKTNVETMQTLLKKKDAALERVNTQLHEERRRFAAEKQIDAAKIAQLHQQLHKENSDVIKKFSDRLNSITLAPPLAPDDGQPTPGSLMDVKMAQLMAETSRLQSRLDLADEEIRRLKLENNKLLFEKKKEVTVPDLQHIATATSPHLGAGGNGGGGGGGAPPPAPPGPGAPPTTSSDRFTQSTPRDPAPAAPPPEDVALLQLELKRLQELLDAERAARADAAKEEAKDLAAAAKAAPKEEEEEALKLATADAASSPLPQAPAPVEVVDDAAGHAEKMRAVGVGTRVLATRDVYFRSGKRVLSGDAGVVRAIICDGEGKGEDRKVEVIFDKGVVYDALVGRDVEATPQPSFTVSHETPVETVNLIILQRETMIRQQALQIDTLERDHLLLSQKLSNALDAEQLATRREREMDETVAQLTQHLKARRSDNEDTLKVQLVELKKALKEAEAERDDLHGDLKSSRAAVKSLKAEVVAVDKINAHHTRRQKADDELRKKFDDAQEDAEQNQKSMAARLAAMQRDLEKVMDRELTLQKASEELKHEIEDERKRVARDLVKQAEAKARGDEAPAASRDAGSDALHKPTAKTDAWTSSPKSAGVDRGVGGAAYATPHRGEAGMRGGGEHKMTSPMAYGGVEFNDAPLLRRRVDALEELVENLQLKNKVLKQARFSNTSQSAQLDQLIREKAEWTAIKQALVQQLRDAQRETERKESRIREQLDRCRSATERRCQQMATETEAVLREKDARAQALKAKVAELESDAAEHAATRDELEAASQALARTKGELAKAEASNSKLREKHAELQDEERSRKSRLQQARERKQSEKKAARDALVDIGVNTTFGDDAASPPPRAARGTRTSGAGTRTASASTGGGASGGALPRAGATAEVMKYWEENKKLKAQVAALKKKEKRAGTFVSMAEYEKAKAEAARYCEELNFTKEKVREKDEELHQRAVDLHTFEKVKSFKVEIMKLEEENDKLRVAVEVDRAAEVRALQRAIEKKDAHLQRLEARIAEMQKAAPTPLPALPVEGQEEYVASEPHTLLNGLIAESPALFDKLEALRGMFSSLEDRLLEARNEALQSRFTKSSAVMQQQRAERHLKDLLAISPAGLKSVDEVPSFLQGRERLGRDRQIHDLQQVVEGMKQVVQKLQSDNDTLRKNGVSNQKYVELLKENRHLKQTVEKLAAAAAAAGATKPAPPPTAGLAGELAAVKKRLKVEQERFEQLRQEAEEATKKRKETQAQVGVLPEAVAELQAKVTSLEAQKARDSDEKQKLRAECRIFEDELLQRTQRVTALQKDNLSLQAKVAKLESDLSLFDAEFMQEVEDLRNHNAVLLEANAKLRGAPPAGDAAPPRAVSEPAPASSSNVEPFVRGISSLRRRPSGATLRDSVDSLHSLASSTIDDSQIASILQTVGPTHTHTHNYSALTDSTSTLDLSSYPHASAFRRQYIPP